MSRADLRYLVGLLLIVAVMLLIADLVPLMWGAPGALVLVIVLAVLFFR